MDENKIKINIEEQLIKESLIISTSDIGVYILQFSEKEIIIKNKIKYKNQKNRKSKIKINLIKTLKIPKLFILNLQQSLLMQDSYSIMCLSQQKEFNCLQNTFLNIILFQFKLSLKNKSQIINNQNNILINNTITQPYNIQTLIKQTEFNSNDGQIQQTSNQSSSQDFLTKKASSPLSHSIKTNLLNCVIEPTSNCGGVFISDYDYASNLDNLQNNNITAVLSIDRNNNFKLPDTINHKIIIAFDNEMESIKVHFDKTYQFILSSIHNNQNILIHCRRGISRSATILIAFLMKFKKLSYHESFDYLQKRRPIINPNNGFVKQLKAYEIVLQEFLKYTNNDK